MKPHQPSSNTVIFSRDLFAPDTLQVFDKETGEFIGCIATGEDVATLINKESVNNIIEPEENNKQLSLF